ncbi:site-specific integrase [Clostridium beijerinckii]|uniref:Site-specific integrase n=1 Tax=Clostridium beijerinckii TaxID=1520 RepID=A0A7X9SR90_CLOBE|nr:site-specific integrase [Clostridium beijerinckii]NMF06565.1 site-specific integrase [Clostridium beijerinckii]
MASYEQISKDNWKVTVSLGFDSNGKRLKQRKQGFKRKKDAERWATEITSQKHKGYVAPTESNITLKEYINKWFNEYKVNTLSTNTIANYNSRIETHIIPKLGNYKLNKITNEIVQDFYNSLINDGQKPSSAKKVLETLGNCLRYAQKNKLIYTVPVDIERVAIEKPKVEFWHKQEVDFFLSEIKNDYLYMPILITVLTGLRIGELCGLRWRDIDLENRILTVRNQVINDKVNKSLLFTNKLKTLTSYRKITIPKVLANHLTGIKGKALDTDFVILTREGTMCNPRNLSMNFIKKVSKYKLPFEDLKKRDKGDIINYIQLQQITFHALRHTHATLLIFKGENIKVVSERLGHKSITETLDTYTHIMEDMKNNTANLLDDMF